MKVLVCGDRKWRDRDYIFRALDEIHALYGIGLIIEGCATGADRIAGWPCPSIKLHKNDPVPLPGWAAERGIPVDHNPADWDHLGRAAGPLRNRTMLAKAPDMVLAFHRSFNHSKGTKDMVTIAKAEGVQTYVFPNSHWDI